MQTRTRAAFVAAAVTGCTVGPDYVRRTLEAPAAWRIGYPKAAEVATGI
jgi:multidrug efflux system outer membrane protein